MPSRTARDDGPVERLWGLVRSLSTDDRPLVVLVDGGSGSGKTTLARALVDRAPRAQLLRLDDLYPGWDGLDAGSRHLLEHVLEPLADGRPARWQHWDWPTDGAGQWHPIDPDRPLVVDGSGCLSRANRALATAGIWVALEPGERKRRALARDGAIYAEHWDRWAAQEAAFARRENPRALADAEVHGTRILA